jgi:hypothetical protein
MIDYRSWDCKKQGVNLRLGNNVQATQGLFYEWGADEASYTLKNEDVIKGGSHYVSMYQVYMNSVDEYEAALKLVGSMQHWRKLCNLEWFREGIPQFSFDGIEQWRKDMEARDRMLAKRLLIESAENGNVTAQKTLYGDSPKKAGRKKKPEQKEEHSLNPVAELGRITGGS